MAKSVLTFKLEIPETAKIIARIKRETVNEELLQQMNTQVVTEIKRMIKSGQSPVRGFGRFGEYLNPKEYPGKGRGRLKPSRPVNLNLTGEMLGNYTAMKGSGSSIKIGINPFASKFVKTKAKANNEGTEVNGVGAVPRRRFIPLKGEEFAVSVMRKVKNLFALRISQMFSNKK